MRKPLGLLGMLVCLAWPGAARAYVLVEVQAGGVILVEEDGQHIELELAGIWVPDPPGDGVKGHYRGAEARLYVDQLLHHQTAFIREVAPRRTSAGRVRAQVRIRLGEEGEYDLAVSLARMGLGLLDKTSATDPDYLEAIYRAERAARVAQQGMHDGGYQEFARSQRQSEINFGIGNLAVTPRSMEYGLEAYLGDPSAPSQQAAHERPRVRSVVEGIRDWGSSMGLPPDASRHGR